MQRLELSSLVREIRERQGLKSDAAVARFLGVTERTLSNWLHSRNFPSAPIARRIAELAEQDPDALCAYLEAKRAQDPETRDQWLRIVRRLLLSTAIVSVAGATVSGAAQAAMA